MSKAVVIEKDLGMKRIMKTLNDADGYVTAVGYPGQNMEYVKGEPITVAQLAAIHEFGSQDGRIPSRPFMRQAFDTNKKKIDKRLEMEYKNLVDGKTTAKQALSRVGEWFVGAIKATITRGNFTPLKASTIFRKGSSRPLIDTGEMRNSVSHVEIKA